MSTEQPDWVYEVHACDLRGEDLRDAQGRLADERAHIIAKAVAGYGRGGRDIAAEKLGVKVLAIDTAIKRARNAPPPSGLPYDILDRLYALELAELPPLPARLWQGLAQIMAGTLVDFTWVEQPSRIIAQDVAECAGEELDEDDAKQLADAARSWTRIQALAVLDAVLRRDLDVLPKEGCE